MMNGKGLGVTVFFFGCMCMPLMLFYIMNRKIELQWMMCEKGLVVLPFLCCMCIQLSDWMNVQSELG